LERRVEATLQALEKRRADATARLNRAILATAKALNEEGDAGAMSCAPETWKLKDLLDIVLAVTGLPKVGVQSERRDNEVVKARHIFFWLARRFTLRSLPYIGRVIGGRDHTTVLHGTRKVDAVVKAMEVVPENLEADALKARIEVKAKLEQASEQNTPEAWAKFLWENKWPDLPPRLEKR
jgi:chromosomal replication initiation ATPase DnaA